MEKSKKKGMFYCENCKEWFPQSKDTPTEVISAYGIYIKIASSDVKILDKFLAQKKTEVFVDIDGVQKEMTYKEFKERLGFS